MKIMSANLACIFIFSFKNIKKNLLKLFRIIYKHCFRDTSNWKKFPDLLISYISLPYSGRNRK